MVNEAGMNPDEAHQMALAHHGGKKPFQTWQKALTRSGRKLRRSTRKALKRKV
jgi:hypothetical protein